MTDINISFMEISELQESARVLSVAMLDAELHVAVLQGKGENERREIEKMFTGLFTRLPGIIFLAKEKQHRVKPAQNVRANGSHLRANQPLET